MSEVNMQKFLGYRFFKEVGDNEYEVIRIAEVNQKDPTRCTVLFENGKKQKVGYEFIKEYTPLEPFGVVTFNIVKLNNKEGEKSVKDVMVTAHKLIDLKLRLNNNEPYIICRQSVTDFFSQLISKDPTQINMYGFSVTRETCPTNIQMNTLTACSDVLESTMIHVYKDDNVDSMMKCIDPALKYNIDKVLKKLHDDYCDANHLPPIKKMGKVVDGWCTTLELLLNMNNFMVDFNQMCDITGFDVNLLDWMILGDDGLYSLNNPCRLFFSTVFKVNVIDTKVMKFDYTVNMGNFRNDKYALVRDNTNTIWIVVYLEQGEYLEQQLIDEINKLDVTTKLQLAYFNKYADLM